jgi:hypothetical protein
MTSSSAGPGRGLSISERIRRAVNQLVTAPRAPDEPFVRDICPAVIAATPIIALIAGWNI